MQRPNRRLLVEQLRAVITNVLAIAGVDPSGGAGVLADVKAISAQGAYACGVVTALTAQNTSTVTGVLPVASEFVASQIDTLLSDVHVHATKIGMVGGAAVIELVAERVRRWQLANVVLDPVMVAKGGSRLLDPRAAGALREVLLPVAMIATPNLPEAAALLENRVAESLKEMYRAAERLHGLMRGDGERWVLLKGGHLPAGDATDLLFNGDRMLELSASRVTTKNTHGTGCTLSSALAALLPQSADVPSAARRAKAYLTEALAQADLLEVGRGHGPVHHFFRLWSGPGSGS